MACTSVIFENPITGAVREAPVGFSWTTFFFGFFPALFRRDWKWLIIMGIIATITVGLSNFVFMFIYNNLYIKDLIGSGYKAQSVNDENMDLVSAKLGMSVPVLDTVSIDSLP